MGEHLTRQPRRVMEVLSCACLVALIIRVSFLKTKMHAATGRGWQTKKNLKKNACIKQTTKPRRLRQRGGTMKQKGTSNENAFSQIEKTPAATGRGYEQNKNVCGNICKNNKNNKNKNRRIQEHGSEHNYTERSEHVETSVGGIKRSTLPFNTSLCARIVIIHASLRRFVPWASEPKAIVEGFEGFGFSEPLSESSVLSQLRRDLDAIESLPHRELAT